PSMPLIQFFDALKHRESSVHMPERNSTCWLAILRHSETLSSPQHNIYMSCRVHSEFDIQCLHSPLCNLYMSCKLNALQSSIFNSHTVPYPIYTCPVSSLDILQSSIFMHVL